MNEGLIAGLKATKQALQDYGRCPNGPYGADGSVCLVVAMKRAYTVLVDAKSMRGAKALRSCHSDVRYALMACLPEEFDALSVFNDDPGTTDADVYALIDKALAEAGGLGE